MKTKKMREFPEVDLILRYIDYYDSHPHELKRCDGSHALYCECVYVVHLDHEIFDYGEEWNSYERAKFWARRAIRQIKLRGWNQ